MKFSTEGYNGKGSTTSLRPEDFQKFNDDKLQYEMLFHSYIRESAKFETIHTQKLDTTWYYFIYYQNQNIYEFRSYKDFCLNETNEEVSKEQLKELIKISYKKFHENFEKKRVEYSIFNSIPEISDDLIEQNIHPVQEVFNKQFK